MVPEKVNAINNIDLEHDEKFELSVKSIIHFFFDNELFDSHENALDIFIEYITFHNIAQMNIYFRKMQISAKNFLNKRRNINIKFQEVQTSFTNVLVVL